MKKKISSFLFPIHLAEEMQLDINPVLLGYFPSKAMEAMGWTEETFIIMTVEGDGFRIREIKNEELPDELIYEPVVK
jgi:hypothetical protein